MDWVRPGILGLIGALGISGAAPAASSGPALASSYDPATMPLGVCFEIAQSTIETMGYPIELTPFSRYGSKGGYTVSIRCVEEEKLVLFLASGPNRKTANALVIQLQTLFGEKAAALAGQS